MSSEYLQKIIVSIALFSFVGCASRANNISASYVPALKYQNHNCDQIKQKLESVCQKVNVLTSIQNSAANVDAVALPAGIISLWFPVLFMSGGSHEKELAQLKGDINALEQTALEKQCSDVITLFQEQRKTVLSTKPQVTE
jgi:hypothetical protein